MPLVASILDGTEPGVMAEILADSDQRSRHVDTVVAFADDGDFHGIDIDYEQFAFADGRDTWASTRPNWVAFVEELAARLHDDGRILTVSVPPVYDAGQTADSGFWVYDYAAITPHVDAIRVMAYDYSVPAGEPGPIAPLAWVDQVIAGTSAASGDPSKLVLGVPLYGYNWPVATSGTCPDSAEGVTSVTNRTVADLAARRGATPQFDPVTYEWSFTYDLVVEDGTTSCTQTRRGPLRRRRRRPGAHATSDRRRLRRRRPVRPRLRRRGHVGGDRHRGGIGAMKVHLVDGTYELFRQNFGRAAREPDAGPYAATTGVLASTLQLIADGATHVGVASDHVIESFRNDMWPGYKTSAGMPPELLAQIPVVEEALVAMGVTTWAMVVHEADDALAAAAAVADADERVEQVLIVTPDKDLGQCVRGRRVVQFDRRKREMIDEDGVVAKFGVPPASIPDYLGLVGDSADGYPGIPGWGAKSASAVLARYGHLEDIPDHAGQWDVPGLRGAAKLSIALRTDFELALLFRRIATVETDVDVGTVDDWAWSGPTPEFAEWAERLGEPRLAERAAALAASRR